MKASGWFWTGATVAGLYLLLSRSGSAQAASLPPYSPSVNPTASQRVEVVRGVQRVLREEGLYEGAIDGIAGPATGRALSAYLLERPSLAARLAAISNLAQREYETARAVLAHPPAETQTTQATLP